MTEEQLAAVRLYTSEEVVEKLALKLTWLKNWITENRVPHLRSGVDRGVQFTAAQILEIGRMLPELLGGRRGGSLTGGTSAHPERMGHPTSDSAGQLLGDGERRSSPPAMPPVVDISAWSQLRAHRPRPRNT